jgi:hypothetical protein
MFSDSRKPVVLMRRSDFADGLENAIGVSVLTLATFELALQADAIRAVHA